MDLNFDLKKLKTARPKIFKKEKMQINPDKYWIFILIINFVLILGSAAFGYYLFLQANKYTETENYASTKHGIKVENLNAILKLFENKELESEKIKQNPASVVDPSL